MHNVTVAGTHRHTCRPPRPGTRVILQRGLEVLHAVSLFALPWTLRLLGPYTVAGATVQLTSAALGGARRAP